MKKFINAAEQVEDQMLQGMVKAYPQYLRKLDCGSMVVRAGKKEGKVALISGGGSGHEPAHGGYVGEGMLDAAVAGAVFASPTPDQVYEGIKAVATDAGVLMVIKNYTGDEITDLLLGQILADIDYTGSEVAVMINSSGATPLMELFIINSRVADVLAEKGIKVYKTFVGEYMTSIEMAGFSISLLKLDGLKDKEPGDVLKTVDMTLVSTVGGASGPLYGTGFMKMGAALKGKAEITAPDFLAALQAAIEGIMQRGRSTRGEKTMLDAMIPAKEAMEAKWNETQDAKAAFGAGVAAAWEGVEFTKTIAATKGRASYLGERSIGHQDPGATSFTMVLEIAAGEV